MIDFAIIILAAGGFLTSWHIYATRKAGKPLKCWYDNGCNKVLGSKYSHLLGLPNESIGMAYYFAVAAFEAAKLAGWSFAASGAGEQAVMAAASAALLFSMMLFCIQIGLIRTICEYCVLGMTFTALIWLALQYAA